MSLCGNTHLSEVRSCRSIQAVTERYKRLLNLKKLFLNAISCSEQMLFNWQYFSGARWIFFLHRNACFLSTIFLSYQMRSYMYLQSN